MKQKKSKKSSIVGRRTGVDIVALNKTLKLNEDGFESFGDYWQDSSSSRDGSPTYMNSSPVNSDVKTISSFVKNITGSKRESISFINPSKSPFLHKRSHVESPYPHLVENKLPRSRKPYTKGRRTGVDVIAGKDINVNENIEDFKGYWTSTQSDFNTEVNSSNTGKVSIPGGSRSCSSDFNTDESSKTINNNNSNTNLLEGNSLIEAARADSTLSPSPSNLNPSLNSTLINKIQTFKAPPSSDLIENSEVTSTTVDGNKFEGCCNKTPTAVRRRSPRKSPLPKNDVKDTLHGTIRRSPRNSPLPKNDIRGTLHGTFVKKLPFSETSQNSVSDSESSNSDEEKENNNDEIPKTQETKELVLKLTRIAGFENNENQSESNQRISDKEIFPQAEKTQKTKDYTFQTTELKTIRVENNEIESESNQSSSDEENVNQNEETPKSKDYTFRTTNQEITGIKNCEIETVSSNKTFSKLEANNKNENRIMKSSLSTTSNRVESDYMSSSDVENNETNSIASNCTISNDEAESAKEKTKHSVVQKEKTVTLSSHNNEMNRTQTHVIYMSSIDLPEAVQLNQTENLLRSTKSKSRKHKVNLSTSRNKDKSDSISFTSQDGKRKKINSPVIENDKIHFLASQDKAEESACKKTKYCATHQEEINGTQTLVNNMSSKNSPDALHSNHISRTPISSGSKSRGRKCKKNLSTSRKRDETDCMSSSDVERDETVSNCTISDDKSKNTKEKTKRYQAQKGEPVSLPTSLSFYNNEVNRTQTIVNNVSSIDLPEAVHLNQIENLPSSTKSKSETRKHKVNLSTPRKRDKSDSISFTSQVGKQKKINSSVIENAKICSLASNSTFSQDPPETTNKKTKYCATQKEEISRTQILANNMSSKNSPHALHSNHISRTPKSTGSKSRGRKRKKNLSTSRKRDETDCMSSSDIENGEVETKHSESKKQDISLPTHVSLNNNEKTSTKTLVHNMSSRNSPVVVHVSQIARTPKSAEYKSHKGKSKHDSSTSRKRNEIARETMQLSQNKTIDEIASKVLPETNKSSERVKKSDLNLNSKSKKRKFRSSIATLSDNIKIDGNCSQMPALRRSKREKVAPLESWRLERRVFGYKNGELIKINYEEGFPEDKRNIDVFKKHKIETKKKKPEKKNLKLNDNSVNMELIQSNIEKVSCINPYTGEEELLYLHRPYHTLLWSVPPSQDEMDPSYTLSKSQSGELISFGYIEIGVKKKKDKQYSPTDNITLVVMQGKIKVLINNKEINLTEKDTMTVPSGNGYSIKNTGKIPALLNFCTYKVPFFDYQFGEHSETA